MQGALCATFTRRATGPSEWALHSACHTLRLYIPQLEDGIDVAGFALNATSRSDRPERNCARQPRAVKTEPHRPSTFSRTESCGRCLPAHSVLTLSDMELNCPAPPGPAPPSLELPEAVRSRTYGGWTASRSSICFPARMRSTPTSDFFV